VVMVFEEQATSDLSAAEVMEAATRLLSPRARRVTRPAPGSVVLALGSRLKYRLIGAAVATRDVPVKLRVDVNSNGLRSRLKLTLTSDEGWYLFATWRRDAACEASFNDLLKDMRQAGIIAAVD